MVVLLCGFQATPPGAPGGQKRASPAAGQSKSDGLQSKSDGLQPKLGRNILVEAGKGKVSLHGPTRGFAHGPTCLSSSRQRRAPHVWRTEQQLSLRVVPTLLPLTSASDLLNEAAAKEHLKTVLLSAHFCQMHQLRCFAINTPGSGCLTEKKSSS